MQINCLAGDKDSKYVNHNGSLGWDSRMCLGEEKGVPSLHSVYKCAVTRGGEGGKPELPPTRKHNLKEGTPESESQ